ncbi:hypothetical protein GGF31_007704 [Allomyces arbusculus]|nr:hypothetical protein GGF31_007704 [Allomyces arbusculus]
MSLDHQPSVPTLPAPRDPYGLGPPPYHPAAWVNAAMTPPLTAAPPSSAGALVDAGMADAGHDDEHFEVVCSCGQTHELPGDVTVQCETCLTWQHVRCTPYSKAQIDELVGYACEPCRAKERAAMPLPPCVSNSRVSSTASSSASASSSAPSSDSEHASMPPASAARRGGGGGTRGRRRKVVVEDSPAAAGRRGSHGTSSPAPAAGVTARPPRSATDEPSSHQQQQQQQQLKPITITVRRPRTPAESPTIAISTATTTATRTPPPAASVPPTPPADMAAAVVLPPGRDIAPRTATPPPPAPAPVRGTTGRGRGRGRRAVARTTSPPVPGSPTTSTAPVATGPGTRMTTRGASSTLKRTQSDAGLSGSGAENDRRTLRQMHRRIKTLRRFAKAESAHLATFQTTQNQIVAALEAASAGNRRRGSDATAATQATAAAERACELAEDVKAFLARTAVFEARYKPGRA